MPIAYGTAAGDEGLDDGVDALFQILTREPGAVGDFQSRGTRELALQALEDWRGGAFRFGIDDAHVELLARQVCGPVPSDAQQQDVATSHDAYANDSTTRLTIARVIVTL